MAHYRARDWYWVGRPSGYPDTITYSSSAGKLVTAIPPAWLTEGREPTPWPRDERGTATVAALDAVLASAGLPPTGLTKRSSS